MVVGDSFITKAKIIVYKNAYFDYVLIQPNEENNLEQSKIIGYLEPNTEIEFTNITMDSTWNSGSIESYEGIIKTGKFKNKTVSFTGLFYVKNKNELMTIKKL